MRLRCTTSILVLAVAACGSSSAASERSLTATQTAPARATSCGPLGAQTRAASRLARVYKLRGNVYGCAIGHRRSYLLGAGARSIREGEVAPIAVAGQDAAYGLTSFGVDTGSAVVIVRNLADGRQLHLAVATTRHLVEAVQSVDALVVKADGAAAWISQVQSLFARASRVLEVDRVDDRGQASLDSGRGIYGHSLRLRGSTLTWRDGSVTRTSTLR